MSLRKVRALALLGMAAAALYLSFELGRYQSGFSLLDQRRQREAASLLVAEKDRQIDELQRQIAILQTSQNIDSETYAGIEANLAELEARIQAQEEELGFYRGIVAPGDGVAGLRVQNLEILRGAGEATHTLRVLLVQAIVHNDRVSGSVRVSVIGEQDGENVELGLGDLGVGSRATDIPYGFRYFQSLEIDLRLPDDLIPAEVEIQVWPGSPRGETIVERFPWPAAAG